MQSAYMWASLTIAVVLIVLVIALVVVLRWRSPQVPASRHARTGPAAPPVEPSLGRPPAAATGTFNRASAAVPAALPREGRSFVTHREAVGHALPEVGSELPRRMPGRPWPAVGVRELAASARTPEAAPPSAPSTPVLHGTVRGDDGALLANAVLTVINVTGGQAGTARTGADGSYQLSIPGEGAYVLIARGVNHEPHASTVEVRGSHTVFDIRLTSAAGLMGIVSDTAGAAVPDATVILTNTTGVVVSAQRTNSQGGYAISDLAPGLYTVTTAAEGYDPVATLVDVPPTGVVRQNVTFAPRRVSLWGTAVHEADGRPLSDIRVRLLDEAGREVATVHTGPDGRYEFGGLGVGQYTVVATGYPKVSSAVELTEHDSAEHQVRMGYRPEALEPAGAGALSTFGGENSGYLGEERGR